MSQPSLSRAVSLFTLTFIAAAVVLLALPAFASSQARIVRLSDVQGMVEINKNAGAGFESAFLNLPITQGVQLRTKDRGRAEVEFEDGSTLRLIPDTTVEFTTLGVNDAGKRVSSVKLISGMAYLNWLGKDSIALNFSRETVALDRPAHIRAEVSNEAAHLAVFKGDVDVEGPEGKVMLGKNRTATFDASADDKSTVADKVAKEPLDSWDKDANSYHTDYAKNSVQSPYGYGLSDLNYYGNFATIPGYGMMWQPFFTGVGWDPFMDGAWGFYPGMGYMFASAYPWGWLPYRYGSWMSVPGYGWMWQPGGWNNWLMTPGFSGPLPNNFRPPVAPAAGTMKTVAVGHGGTATPMAPSRLVVRSGSAGMGIARGSLDNMRDLNHQVARSGFAEVHAQPQFSTSAPRVASFGDPFGREMGGGGMGSASAGHASPVAGHASSTSTAGSASHK